MSSHASREWITSGLSSALREPDLPPERGLLLVARRVLVVEVEAGLADRDALARSTASGSSIVPLRGELRRVVRMQPDGRVHVGVPRRERRAPRCDVARSVPTHTIHSTPARARARASTSLDRRPRQLQVAVRVDPARHATSLRGNSGSPFSKRRARGQLSPRRRGGQARVLGPAGQTEPAPQLARRVRDHRRREQRDDAQRLEAVAEHARDRGGVARLVAAPTAARSSMYAFVARIRSQTAPKPAREVEPRHRVGRCPSNAVAAASRSGPSARVSGTTPPQ